VNALGGERRYRTGWALGAWFVPILALFRPKQIANDIWRLRPGDQPPPLLAWWWGAFLIFSWANGFVVRAFFRGDTVAELRSADLFSMVDDALDVVAALLAVAVIRAITVAQSARAAEVFADAAEAPLVKAQADA
jgi:hypothetical protein